MYQPYAEFYILQLPAKEKYPAIFSDWQGHSVTAICLLKINKKDEAIAALEAIAHMGQEHNAQDEQYKLKALNLLSVIKG